MFTFWPQKLLLICPRIIAPIRYVYLIGVKNILIFLLVVFAYFAGRRRRRERWSRSRSRITCMRMFILNVVCLFVCEEGNLKNGEAGDEPLGQGRELQNSTKGWVHDLDRPGHMCEFGVPQIVII